MLHSDQDETALLAANSDLIRVSKALWVVIAGTFIFGVAAGMAIVHFWLR